MTLETFLTETKSSLESALTQSFQQGVSDELTSAIHYSLLNGGKRLRPSLVRAASDLVRAPDGLWLIPAQALEMIHVYSLVHDDLPAMDDDDLRRGKPTCHRQFSEATAILAGDALQSEAFALIAGAEALSPRQIRDMVRLLAQSAGARGMVGGQMIDLASEQKTLTLNELSDLHRLKTGALISASLQLGALCHDSVDVEILARLARYGDAIGLAFQIADDILDVTGTTEKLGKPQGSDLAAEKSTYVKLLGVDGARSEALRQIDCAKNELTALKLGHDSMLWQLADYIIERDH
ncbi:polyprenyl synthetase family protein [Reinekea blandensis]|uniref:Geranyltranstransferase (Farnesyldiphosphate synthase or FPP synthase) n=1 Tax=Reinekea blandensis MED297 TaxID=314283 RepID=A4BG71_9GAMM|nr:farnesyl diphosphate synthase [Reinekea blandensis]EAR08866.1 geranyltranstransferase (farnesyldiphosphate synthase or FPP synthase) [Reinekea sp. MED297] [Reinekea blandensis MED297]